MAKSNTIIMLCVEVHRVLPGWLANPTVVAGDIRTEKVPLTETRYLDEAILQRLRDNGITHLFPGLSTCVGCT